VLGSAIPRAPSATDVKPWQAGRFGGRFEGSRIPLGACRDALSFRGSSQTSGSPSAPSARDQAGRFTAPGSESHRLAGSWANDHGVAAHLSCNASTRVNVLTIVSAIRQAVLACAAGRGWPDLRLRELRVCAYLVREIQAPRLRGPMVVRLRKTSLLRKARGVNPLAESRFAPANHSAHCFGSSAPRRS
jgi:hypothetical protein